MCSYKILRNQWERMNCKTRQLCRRNAPSNYGNLGQSKKRRETSGLTTGDQKKGRQDVVDQTPLTLWEKKWKKSWHSSKRKWHKDGRSEQQKMLKQQNNVLQQMQLQKVIINDSRCKTCYQHSCNKVNCKAKLCWPLLKSLLKKTES